MHVPRLRRPTRVRGGILGIVTALILAFPVGVLAGATFNDVPTDHPFYADVEALVASGVTAGCGSGNYCPNAFVTRGQMAAFMNRLGALASDKTPVVNAAELNGLSQSAFHRYTTTAPFGSVQYGFFGVSGNASAGGTFDAGYASFPVPLATSPTPHVITPGDPLPTGCSGTSTSPSADAGHLCVFVTYELNTDGSYTIYNAGGGAGASRQGFAMDMSSASGGNYAVNATYAVGGPLLLTLDAPDEPSTGTLGTD